MTRFGFLCLTRDAGIGAFDLLGDIAAVARAGDRVVLVDDGSRDDTLAWAGRFTAMRGFAPGVEVVRIATATRGAGDLGIAANLALGEAAGLARVLLLPGGARLDAERFAAARALAEAGDLPALAGEGPPSLHRLILRPEGLRCDEGRAAHGDLALLWRFRDAPSVPGFVTLPSGPPPLPALFEAATALVQADPRAADWLLEHLPLCLTDVTPGARAMLWPVAREFDAALSALSAGTETVLRRALRDGAAFRAHLTPPPSAPRIGGARLRIACLGRHAHRQPFAYAALRPLWQDRVALTEDPARADLILFAHPRDAASQTGLPEGTPLALLSEEPFWDTLFSPDPLAAEVTLPTGGGPRRVHQANHHSSAVFDFDALPYYLLTDHRFAAAFGHRFARNARQDAAQWAAAWAACPRDLVFMAERRPESFHDLKHPGGDILGLCAWRTRLAEAATGAVDRLGATWQGGPTRFDLPDWHLDKLVRLDGRARLISGIENTHQPAYISEKLFDAFACGAVPVFMASPGHRLHDLDLPEEAWINLWGQTEAGAAATLGAWRPGPGTAAAYARAQAQLARLFTDPRIWLAERARLRRALLEEVTRLADAGA
jgi:hypothetical protein